MATYHVAVDGSGDFTTVAQVNAATFVAGDVVLFKCGDTWAETLVLTNRSGLTFSNYGVGKLPTFDGAATRANSIYCAQDASNLVVDGLKAINATEDGIKIVGTVGNPTTNIILSRCLSSSNAYIGINSTGGSDITLKNNVTQYNNRQGLYIQDNNVCEIYHNTIMENNLSNTNSGNAHIGTGNEGIIFKNNIMYQLSVSDDSNCDLFISDTTKVTSDFNCIYETVYTNIVNANATNYTTLALYVAATSQDTNSINTNPLFMRGYWPQYTSPCLGYGTDVGIYNDFLGCGRVVPKPPALLAHFDGTDESTDDYKAETGQNITLNGTAKLDSAQKQFGSTSLWLDGDSDYGEITGDLSFCTFDERDFTIAAWGYKNDAMGTLHGIIAGKGGGSPGWEPNDGHEWAFFIYNDNYMYFQFYRYYKPAPSLVISSGTVDVDGGWHHFAFTKSGSTGRLFLDGQVIGSGYIDKILPKKITQVMRIGDLASNEAGRWLGWLDDVLIVNGVAVWTRTFSVPTAAHTLALLNGFPAIGAVEWHRGVYRIVGTANFNP